MGLRLRLLLATCAFICVPLGEAWAPSPGDRKDCKDPRDFTDLKQGPYPHQRHSPPSLSRWAAPGLSADRGEAAASWSSGEAQTFTSRPPTNPMLSLQTETCLPDRSPARLGSGLGSGASAAAAAGAGSGAMFASGDGAAAGAGAGASFERFRPISSFPGQAPGRASERPLPSLAPLFPGRGTPPSVLERPGRHYKTKGNDVLRFDNLPETFTSRILKYLPLKEQSHLQVVSQKVRYKYRLSLLPSHLFEQEQSEFRGLILSQVQAWPDTVTSLWQCVQEEVKSPPMREEMRQRIFKGLSAFKESIMKGAWEELLPQRLLRREVTAQFLCLPSPQTQAEREALWNHEFLAPLQVMVKSLKEREEDPAFSFASSAAGLTVATPAASAGSTAVVAGFSDSVAPGVTEGSLKILWRRLRLAYETYGNQLCRLDGPRRLSLLSLVQLRGDLFSQPYFVPEDVAYTLLSTNPFGIVTKANQEGSSPVANVGGLHFKRNVKKGREHDPLTELNHLAELAYYDALREERGPYEGTLNPGMEWALYAFSKLLTGEGVPPSSLLSLTHVPQNLPKKGTPAYSLAARSFSPGRGEVDRKEIIRQLSLAREEHLEKVFKGFTLQASQTLRGEGLHRFLEKVQEGTARLQDLDLRSFSALVVGSLLTRPADGKPDNFIVTPEGRIVSIDNDLAFASPFIQKNGEHFLESRTILYCLTELMNQPLDPKIRQTVLAHSPEVFLVQWLGKLKEKQYHYDQWISRQALPEGQLKSLSLPVRLKEGTLLWVRKSFSQIQKALRRTPHLSHQDLLATLSPLVAVYYQKASSLKLPQEGHPYKERFNKIYGHHDDSSVERVVSSQQLFPDGQTVAEILKQETALEGAYKIRMQSLEEAAFEMLQRTDLTPLAGNVRRDLLEIALRYFPEPVDRVTHPSWTDPFLLHGLLPYGPSLDLVNYLIQKIPSSLQREDIHKRTLLHQAARYGGYRSAQLIKLFHGAGALLEPQDRTGKTPLDVVMEQVLQHKGFEGKERDQDERREAAKPKGSNGKNQGNERDSSHDPMKEALKEAVCYLISQGATHVHIPLVQEFAQSLREGERTEVALQTLRARAPELAWAMALDRLLPVYTPSNPFPGVPVQGATLGPRFIPAPLAVQLFDRAGQMIPRKLSGRHSVGWIDHKGQRIYFKLLPELPGLEEAVGILTRQIMGIGAPQSELLKINGLPFMATLGIQGETLQEVLRKDPERLNHLDPESLSSLFLMTMLTNPEDGKPDNFIVEPMEDSPGQYRLVGIDNDHAFVPPVALEKKPAKTISEPVIQVKTILYCLKQMNDVVQAKTRERFLNLNAGDILKHWIEDLAQRNMAYLKLFTRDQILTYLDKHNCYLGIPFPKQALTQLYDKIIRLQRVLLTHPRITHMELLKQLEPYLAHRYAKPFPLYKTVSERFRAIDGSFYGPNGETITQSGHILRSMQVPPKESLLDALQKDRILDVDYRFNVALRELERLRESHQTFLIKQASGGKADLASLRTLSLEMLSQFLGRINFQSFLEPDQRALLELVEGKPFRELRLQNTSVPIDRWLPFFVTLSHLQTLDLRGSKGIGNSFLSPTNWFLSLSEEAPFLQTLNLSHIEGMSEFSDRGLILSSSIVFEELRSLNLEGCTNLMLIRLIAPHLEWLNASYCPKLAEVTVKTAALQNIYLANTAITNETALALIADNPQLKQMNLEGCSNVRERIQEWGQNLARDSLELSVHTIGAVGVQHVAKVLKVNRGLTYLNLRYNLIEDEGVGYIAEALKDNKTLTQLDLLHDQIGDKGAGFLAGALKVNQTLTHMNLRKSHIGDAGAKYVADALKVNKRLTHLDLGRNWIGDRGAEYVAKALKVNRVLTQLDLGGTNRNFGENRIRDVGAGYIADALKVNPVLTQLDLSRNQIGDKGAEYLAGTLADNQVLAHLNLENNKIGDGGAKFFVKVLKKKESLTHIYLDHNKISNKGAKHIAYAHRVNQRLANVKLNVRIQNNTKATVSYTGGFDDNEDLSDLEEIDKRRIKDLEDAEKMKRPRILENFLKDNPQLMELRFYCNRIGEEETTVLGRALKVSRNMRDLDLSGNKIGEKGAGSLAGALKKNQSLTILRLSDDEIGAMGMGALANALLVNKFLTHLHLDSNAIGAMGAGYIAEALKRNKSLTHLNLRWNEIGDEGAGYIAASFRDNKSLTDLDLGGNNIGAAGAASISDGLKKNQTLTTLGLSMNKIRDKGAEYIVDALKDNKNLTHLNLRFNEIAVESLVVSLKVNQTFIDLRNNQGLIDPRGQEKSEGFFNLTWNLLAQNKEMLNGWIQHLSEPLGKALLGRAPGSDVLTERGNQSLSLMPSILLTQTTSPGATQSQFPRETLHLILSYILPFNLREWFEQAQKTGPVKETGTDMKKDDEKDDKKNSKRDDKKDSKDDKKDSGKDSKKDEKREGRSDRKLAPSNDDPQVLRAASNQPLMTAGGEPLYEFLMSGENSGCAVYCLGFPHHTAARNVLLEKSGDPLIRGLIVPEIRADLAANGIASRFIAADGMYKKLQRDEESATLALNAETQRLTQKLNLAKTATREELEKALPPEDLQIYKRLAEAKAKTDEAFKSYLSSEEVFIRFVSESLRDGIMQTYIPGQEASSLLDALSRIQGYNLRVMGKTYEGRLAVLHEYVWDGTKSTHLLLHTKYQDAEGRPIVGGTPGTVLQNNWNHFNLLAPHPQIPRR